MKNSWIKAKVLKGDKKGRLIGFPTVNLDPKILPVVFNHGIYSALVKYKNNEYLGTLFFGPRLVKGENHAVLEIYIHNFTKDIYEQDIEFIVHSYIRDVRNFASFEELKKEMVKDVEKTKSLLSEIKPYSL